MNLHRTCRGFALLLAPALFLISVIWAFDNSDAIGRAIEVLAFTELGLALGMMFGLVEDAR